MMTETEHRPREHDVLCQRCFNARTWNHDAICDACKAAECAHEHIDYQEAEPDVGLRFGAICEDCGQDVTDWALEQMAFARDEALIRKGEIEREEGWR
jgi:hypothetical protein